MYSIKFGTECLIGVGSIVIFNAIFVVYSKMDAIITNESISSIVSSLLLLLGTLIYGKNNTLKN